MPGPARDADRDGAFAVGPEDGAAGRIVFPVIGTQAYWLAIRGGQFGPASALALVMVPLLLAALVVLFRSFDPPEEARA